MQVTLNISSEILTENGGMDLNHKNKMDSTLS